MKPKFVLDEEINLLKKDEKGESIDYLNTQKYVEVLKECILNAPKNKPFTIGLFGEWGSGKSSIIKTVQDELIKGENEKIKIITYNAWKYAQDSFRRTFITQIQKDLKFDSLETLLYCDKTVDTNIKLKPNITYIVIIAIILLVFLGIIIIPNTISISLKLPIYAIIFILSIYSIFNITKFLSVINGMFDKLKTSVHRLHFFAPEQFENCFNEMIEKSMKQYTRSEKAISWMKGDRYEKDIDRLIIVMDNIDRCNQELAYELLTNIKKFLGSDHAIIFVIPVAIETLRKYIINTNNVSEVDCDSESDEFLRKIFNVSIRIKPFQREEMYDFADKLNKKYELNFNPITISLVSKEFATNPRRIIQIFNDLTIELACFKDDFSEKYQSEICKILIIREEFPDYYRDLIECPEKIFETPTIGQDDTEKKKKASLFLSKTTAVTMSTDIKIIEKIISNSVVFGDNNIPAFVKLAIENIEIESVLTYMGKDEKQRNYVILYLISKLETAIRRNLYKTDVKNIFDFILHIAKKNKLHVSDNKSIYDIIKDPDNLDAIITNIDNYENIILYGISLNKQNINGLTDRLIEDIADFSVDTEIPEKILKAIIFGCSKWENNQLSDNIKKLFFKAYKQDNSILKINYGSNSDALYSTDVINYIIDNIDPNNSYNGQFMHICGLINLSEPLFNKYIDKMNSFIPNYQFNNPSNSSLIDNCIMSINEKMNIFQDIVLSDITHIIHIYTKLSQIIISYPNTQSSYIYDNIENEGRINNCIQFFYYISKMSRQKIVTDDVMDKIYIDERYVYLINEKFVELLKGGYNISYYSNTILKESNRYSDNLLTLLRHLMLGKNQLEKSIIQTKLTNMLDLIWRGDEKKEKIMVFLENLISSKDDNIKNIISEILSSNLPKENIMKLSSKIQNTILNVFVNDIDKYQDNQAILELIATSENISHIKKLTSIINRKINALEKGSQETGLAIIYKLKRIPKTEANSIIANLKLIMNDEDMQSKENVENAISHLNKIIE